MRGEDLNAGRDKLPPISARGRDFCFPSPADYKDTSPDTREPGSGSDSGLIHLPVYLRNEDHVTGRS